MEVGFPLQALASPRLDQQRALNSFSEMDLLIEPSLLSEKSFCLDHCVTMEWFLVTNGSFDLMVN